MTRMTMNDALLAGLHEEMARDARVYVMGQDVGAFGGPLQSARGLWDAFGATGRVIDAPISESAMVGTSVGAAMTGMRPVVEIMFAEFLTLAMTPLALDGGSIAFRSGGRLRVPLVIRTKFGVGPHRGHAEACSAMLASFPGVKVVVPSNPRDAKGLMVSAIRDDDPVVLFEHMGLLHGRRADVPDEPYTVPIGRAEIQRPGTDVTVVASGLMVSRAMRAAAAVAQEGIELEVVDLRTLTPLDTETVVASLRRTGRLVVVDEAWPFGGVAAELVAQVAAHEVASSLTAPILRVQPPPIPVPFSAVLERSYLPDDADIAQAARRAVGKPR